MTRQPDTERPVASAKADPLNRWLALVAGLLVVVVLGMTLAFILYLRAIEAPRTASERDIDRYRTAVAEDPLDQQNHLLLAYAYAQAGRMDRARETLERAAELGETPDLAVARAEVLRVSGSYEEAIDAYTAAKRATDDAYAAQLLALEQAAILEIPPDRLGARVLFGRGLAYLGAQDPASAVQDFQDALEITPTDAGLLVALGDAQAARSNESSATAAYRRALEFTPGLPEAIEGLRALGIDVGEVAP